MTPQAFMEILGGGTLMSVGARWLFKNPALLALGISLVFDILLLMTIKDWWDE